MDDIQRFYFEVGKRIRQARHPVKAGGRKTSQNQLAQAAALTRTSVANIECGRQKILLHTLVAFAEALGVEPATLIPPLTKPVSFPAELEPKERQFVETILKTTPKRR